MLPNNNNNNNNNNNIIIIYLFIYIYFVSISKLKKYRIFNFSRICTNGYFMVANQSYTS